MFNQQLTRLSLIAIVFGLTACATGFDGLTPTSEQAMPVVPTNKVSTGSMIAVPPGGGFDGNQAKVVDEYYSASGRHCVRVELIDSGNAMRIICQRDGGSWSFTRSLLIDEKPAQNDEVLITTPLNANEPDATKLKKSDQSSVADVFGTVFATHYADLTSFEVQSVWNYMGTVTAGPTKWKQLAMAGIPALSDSVAYVGANEPITGRH